MTPPELPSLSASASFFKPLLMKLPCASCNALLESFKSVDPEEALERATAEFRKSPYDDDYPLWSILEASHRYQESISDLNLMKRFLDGGRLLVTVPAEISAFTTGQVAMLGAIWRLDTFFSYANKGLVSLVRHKEERTLWAALRTAFEGLEYGDPFTLLGEVDEQGWLDKVADGLSFMDGVEGWNPPSEEGRARLEDAALRFFDLQEVPPDCEDPVEEQQQLEQLGQESEQVILLAGSLVQTAQDLAAHVDRDPAGGAPADQFSWGSLASLQVDRTRLELAKFGLMLLERHGEDLGIGRDGRKVLRASQAGLAALQSGNLYVAAGVFLVSLFSKQRDPMGEALRGIAQALERVSEQIHKLHVAVYDLHLDMIARTDRILEEVLFNQQMIAEVIREPLSLSEAFLASRADRDGRSFDFHEGRFTSYEGMARHFVSFSDEFARGPARLELYVRSPGVHVAFHLHAAIAGLAGDARGYLERVQTNLDAMDELALEFVKEHWTDSLEMFISMTCLGPVRPLRIIQADKSLRDAESKSDSGQVGFAAESLGFVKLNRCTPVNTVAVEQAALSLLATHYYYLLMEHPQSPRLLQRVELEEKAAEDFSRRGRIVLAGALRLVDLAIYQVAVSAGHWLEPLMTRLAEELNSKGYEFDRDSKPKDPLRVTLVVALATSPTLGTNWIVQYLNRQFDDQPGLFFRYECGLRSEALGRALLEELLPAGSDLRWEPERRQGGKLVPARWVIRFPALPGPPGQSALVAIPLPGANAVRCSSLASDERLGGLYRLRQLIIDALMGYEVGLGLVPDGQTYAERAVARERVLLHKARVLAQAKS